MLNSPLRKPRTSTAASPLWSGCLNPGESSYRTLFIYRCFTRSALALALRSSFPRYCAAMDGLLVGHVAGVGEQRRRYLQFLSLSTCSGKHQVHTRAVVTTRCV